MSEERRLAVLRAIVTEYVRTREPVGSKVIASSHDLGVSSATIRNDMAVLEDAGLIHQPHTSAGRVPTDQGYRVFVDRLTTLKPMSAPERRAVEAFLAQSVDLDDVVNRAVRLLAQATHQVAVIQYPSLARETLRRVELVDLGPRRVLVVVITDGGHVDERILELTVDVPADFVATLRARLNEECEGLGAQECAEACATLLATLTPEWRAGAEPVVDCLVDLLRPQETSRIVMAGMSNLARAGVDFRDIAPVLDALEEQVVLLRLFSEIGDDTDEVHVSIGAENSHDALAEASVVAGTYGAGSATPAHLGIVGPTRMDYARTMATVRAVAAHLSRYLDR